MQTERALSTNVAVLTAQTFDEVVRSAELPIVVVFSTDWCPPCKALAPIIEDLARETADHLRFAEVDAEREIELASRFEVMSYPSLLVFRGGELVKRFIGARGKRHLLEELSAVLDDA